MNNDYISREALKKAVFAEFGNSNLTDAFNDIIDNTPAVKEKSYAMGYQDGLEDGLDGIRPQGEWIIVDDTEQFIAKCSVCGRIEDSRMVKDYPYCHCGADMQKGGVE